MSGVYDVDRADLGDPVGSAVDLSFSQILEAHSWQQQRRRKHGRATTSLAQQHAGGRGHNAHRSAMPSSGRPALGVLDEEHDEDDGEDTRQRTLRAAAARPPSSHTVLPRPVAYDVAASRQRSDTGSTDDDEWSTGSDSGRSLSSSSASSSSRSVGRDVYRFVQPRRLSSWVQDDAVNACFKCHTLFSLLLRKHHCRACGRIFCASCSSQRVVIPGDYEATPLAPSGNVLTSNASELMGSISWYLWSNPAAPSHSAQYDHDHGDDQDLSLMRSAEQRQERFLQDIERLQRANVVTKFTPCRSRSGSLGNSTSVATAAASSGKSNYVPDGSVLQRVCDDCACALQQRRQHYNIVRVFELCQFNLQELRVLGQVCRKWHRASVMCLSMFRQIQYYLPTHRLSEREKALLVINRAFLSGHTKWILQLIKAIDFSHDEEDEGDDARNRALPELSSVDALEILADESIRNRELRGMCVDALLRTATDKEWASFLPVLLHSLSTEANAATSKLGRAVVRQAQCDVRFCYDLFWGLTVMAEDAGCRRKFDGVKQRLLLTLAQLRQHTAPASIGNGMGSNRVISDDIAEQLLRGQEFVDLLYKVPPRIPVKQVRQTLEATVEKSMLFAPKRTSGVNNDKTLDIDRAEVPLSPTQQHWPLLRVPVDPTVKISGIDFKSIEVKRSAEAPMIVTCTGVEREEDDAEVRQRRTRNNSSSSISSVSEHPSPPRPASKAVALPSYRLMYKRDDLRKDAIVQNIINVMYLILKQETRLEIPVVTYRVLPTSSFDGLIEIVENAHTLYSIIRDHGNILNFLHHYNGHRTLSEISSSFRESLAAYTVITFLLGVGDRHADNVMLTKDGILFHIDYGFILGKDPKPLQPPMRLDHYMIEALGGTQTAQFEQFKKLCVIAFNCLRRHVSLFMIMLTLVVKAIPEITDFDMNYTQSDLEAFVIERFLPGQTDDEAATALMLRMEGKLNEKIGLKLSDFVHAHANEKTVSKSIGSVGSSVKVGVEAVSTVASSITSGAASLYSYMWGSSGGSSSGGSPMAMPFFDVAGFINYDKLRRFFGNAAPDQDFGPQATPVTQAVLLSLWKRVQQWS
ncbi:hypothetical protein ATCC90586_006898 [Pythium insidiosum]|nr:hypothetical protein ATCC90586_006898 [Pythium insidiosum]